MTADRETVLREVLAFHGVLAGDQCWNGAGETCGWKASEEGQPWRSQHRAHVARALADALDAAEVPEAEALHCPDCRHAPHGSLGFCPNMASDNECSCTSRYRSPATVALGDLPAAPGGELVEAQARAWDDGWASGMGDAAMLQNGQAEGVTDNPYRALLDTATDAGGDAG